MITNPTIEEIYYQYKESEFALREALWEQVPTCMRDIAYMIAVVYGHGWSGIAASVNDGIEQTRRLNLQEIHDRTPDSPTPFGKGIDGPSIWMGPNGKAVISHVTGTGRVEIEVNQHLRVAYPSYAYGDGIAFVDITIYRAHGDWINSLFYFSRREEKWLHLSNQYKGEGPWYERHAEAYAEATNILSINDDLNLPLPVSEVLEDGSTTEER